MATSSGVFIANVDDYLAPSQACVNPLFTIKEEDKKEDTNVNEGKVLPRAGRQRKRSENSSPSETEMDALPTNDPVKASIVDCLACSGCVTTAETVLLEQQHSLDKMRDLRRKKPQQTVVMTVSPASWANLFQHTASTTDCIDFESKQLQWISLLHRIFHVSAVLDGNLPLQWSLLETAKEFCRAYRLSSIHDQRRELDEDTMLQRQQTPSQALSSTRSQYLLPNGSTRTVTHSATPPLLPVLNSSCPALVCLVEKNTHGAVSHLARSKSPMALAETFWMSQLDSDKTAMIVDSDTKLDNNNKSHFHIAVMPCHDKKLEASRVDFFNEATEWQENADLVITTAELLHLVEEWLDEQVDGRMDNVEETSKWSRLSSLLESTMSTTTVHTWTGEPIAIGTDHPIFITTRPIEGISNGRDVLSQSHDGFYPLGSGGYADFCFRYAARELFSYVISSDIALPWTPVNNWANKTGRQSARVAAQQRLRRDFYQVTLYRHGDGSYSFHSNATGDNDEAATPVLRFACAYGVQTVQRVLQPFQKVTGNSRREEYPYDFVEAMACPSGCLNGGGQLRSAQRETPTNTRQRVQETRERFQPPPTAVLSPAQIKIKCDSSLYTSFHVVPPLKLTMGATAGVALQDTQW